MKRAIALLLSFVFVLGFASFSFAEGGEFDYQSVLGNRQGYSYDKFEKAWSYYGAYAKYFSDATIVIGLQTGSNSNESAPALTTFYVKIMDKSGNKLYEVESIDIMIGDDIYSYNEMLPSDSSSNVIIGEKGMLLIEAINNSEAADVSIRLGIKGKGNMTLEDLDASEYDELKEFCRVYLKYNIWDYCDKETLNKYESFFPLRINGELVELEEVESA